MWLLQRDVLVNYHTEVSPVAIISVKYSRYVQGVKWLHKLFARTLPGQALISCGKSKAAFTVSASVFSLLSYYLCNLPVLYLNYLIIHGTDIFAGMM